MKLKHRGGWEGDRGMGDRGLGELGDRGMKREWGVRSEEWGAGSEESQQANEPKSYRANELQTTHAWRGIIPWASNLR